MKQPKSNRSTVVHEKQTHLLTEISHTFHQIHKMDHQKNANLNKLSCNKAKKVFSDNILE